MVLVIVIDLSETPITAALVKPDGSAVIGAHLKAQVSAVAAHGLLLGTLQQLPAQSLAPRCIGNRQRIQAPQ